MSPDAEGKADGAARGSSPEAGQPSARLALVGTAESEAPRRKSLSKDARPADRVQPSSDVTFFLRAMPSGKGWTWRLFARTGAAGAPRVIYSAERVYGTRREATDRGRRAVATAWAATALSHVNSSVGEGGLMTADEGMDPSRSQGVARGRSA